MANLIGIGLAAVFGSMLLMVVGFALLGTVAASAGTEATDPNLQAGAVGLVKLGPTFFVIIIYAGVLGSIGGAGVAGYGTVKKMRGTA